MDSALSFARLFIIGMGHIIGISPAAPRPSYERCTEYEAIGGDFAAVGNDFRAVMRRHPATPETARQLGAPAQLELTGIE